MGRKSINYISIPVEVNPPNDEGLNGVVAFTVNG